MLLDLCPSLTYPISFVEDLNHKNFLPCFLQSFLLSFLLNFPRNFKICLVNQNFVFFSVHYSPRDPVLSGFGAADIFNVKALVSY